MHRVTLFSRCSVTHFDVSQIMSLESYESKLHTATKNKIELGMIESTLYVEGK